jgi:release factor glutamine methyltransferase
VTLAEYQKKYHEALAKHYDAREARTITQMVFENILSLETHKLSLERFRILTTHQQTQLDNILHRLLRHEPVQYALGEADFYGLKIKVSPAVLIPRPETEELVAWVSETIEANKALRILDIGTGSGCIPISLSKKFPSADVEGLDVSTEALQIAEDNNRLNNTGVKFFRHDILTEELAESAYDIIISNPPYITEDEKKSMAENVLNFEPHLALFVPGDDALLFYRKIAEQATRALKPGGRLFFEINEARGEEVLALMRALSFKDLELRGDLSGKDRMIRGSK